CREVRPGARGERAAQLAVPERPKNRCLRADPETVDRLSRTSVRWPAEWEPHSATWISWPHNEADWPGKFEPILWVYAEIARALAKQERVEILCHSRRVRSSAKKILAAHGVRRNVRLHLCATDRAWLRD